jgi:hypothetical protein
MVRCLRVSTPSSSDNTTPAEGKGVNRMKRLGVAAAVGTAIVVIHGVTDKKWKDAHTLFTVVGAIVALASLSGK